MSEVFRNQSAIITGGGSGIGLACAAAFAQEGASILIMGRNLERLNQGAETLRAIPNAGEIAVCAGDAGNEEDVISAVEIASGLGELKLAVANAGSGWVGRLLDLPSDEWDRVIQLNLSGTFYLLKHTGNVMKAIGGGAFCAISSIAGVRTHRFFGPYGPSKAAMDMLVRQSADELGSMNIRVNSVRPGLVETELAQGLLQTEPVYKDYLDCMPLSRHGQTHDVASAVRFLCGPEASWITGVNLSVDGGHHLRRGPNVDAFFPGSEGISRPGSSE